MMLWKYVLIGAALSTNINAATTISINGEAGHYLYDAYINKYPNPTSIISDSNSSFVTNVTLTKSWSYELSEYLYYQGIEIKAFLNESLFNPAYPGGDWSFQFASPKGPEGQMLETELYNDVYRNPFHSGLQAGMSFGLSASGCNKVGGSFNILEINLMGNMINSLALDFAHTCYTPSTTLISEGYLDTETGMYIEPVYKDAYMYGSIRINSDIPVNVVPIPAAIWLFCSGFIGLIGIASRRK